MKEKEMFGKYRFVIIIITLMAGGFLNIANYIASPLLTSVSAKYSVDISTAGYSVTVVTLFMGIGMLGFAGFIIKKFGNKNALLICLACACCGLALSAFAESFAVFTLGRALIGIAVGVCGTLTSVIIATWFPNKEKPIVMTAQTLANTVFIVGMYNFVVPLFTKMNNNLSAMFLLLAAMLLIICVLWALFGKNNKAFEEYVVQMKASSEISPSSAKKTNPLLLAMKEKQVWMITGVCAFLTIASTGLSAYLPSFFTEVRGFDASQAAAFAGMVSLGSIPGTLCAGALTTIIKKRKTVTVCAMLVYFLSVFAYLSLHANVGIIVSLVVSGAVGAGVYVPIKTFITEMGQSSPEMVTGAFSLVFGVGYIISFFLPSLLKLIGNAVGFGGAMYLFGICAVVGFICSLFIKNK